MRKIVELLDAAPLEVPVLLELVNIKKEKDPQSGAILTMPMGMRDLPIFYPKYLGKDRKIVPDTMYTDETRNFPMSNGVIKEFPVQLRFNQYGNFSITEDKPGLYEFIKNHPLNISNPNLTAAQIETAKAHPCCFAEVTEDRVYQKGAKQQFIKIALLQAINGIDDEAKENRKTLIEFTSEILNKPLGVVEQSINSIVETMAIVGTNRDIANPLLFEAWFDKLPSAVTHKNDNTASTEKSESQLEAERCCLAFIKMGKFEVVNNGNTSRIVQTKNGVQLLEVSSIHEPKVNNKNDKSVNIENLLKIIDSVEEGYRSKLVEFASMEVIGDVSEVSKKFISQFE